MRFAHTELEGVPKGVGWTASGQHVLFGLDGDADRFDLRLWIGLGLAQVRQQLLEMAMANQPPYCVSKRAARANQTFQLDLRAALPQVGGLRGHDAQ